MASDEEVIRLIQSAFEHVKHPGDWNLRGSNLGDEPFLVEEEFTGKTDWRVLDASFLDRSPAGLGTALCFFSDPAFRFYLPAYLIADINGGLKSVEPVFHLVRGFDDKSRSKKVNALMYGDRTWNDDSQHRFSMFSRNEAAAIVEYLEWKSACSPYDRASIEQALQSYWHARANVTQVEERKTPKRPPK